MTRKLASNLSYLWIFVHIPDHCANRGANGPAVSCHGDRSHRQRG